MNTHLPLASPASVDGRSTTDALPASARAVAAVAAPLFFAVAFAQAGARDGFDLRDHTLSLLTNGSFGWIQSLNFALTGALFAAAALAMRRAYPSSRSMRWTAGLLATFGAGLVAAGLFRADPAYGFPPGTPGGAPESVTWHGALHLVVGSISFLALSAACFTAAHYLTRNSELTWARCSRLVGAVFLAGFAGLGANTAATNVGFVVTAVFAFGWASLFLARRPAALTSTAR